MRKNDRQERPRDRGMTSVIKESFAILLHSSVPQAIAALAAARLALFVRNALAISNSMTGNFASFVVVLISHLLSVGQWRRQGVGNLYIDITSNLYLIFSLAVSLSFPIRAVSLAEHTSIDFCCAINIQYRNVTFARTILRATYLNNIEIGE